MFKTVLRALQPRRRSALRDDSAPSNDRAPRDQATTGAPPHPARAYAGPARITYAPERDGDPDPGEVVWAWIPYEEDPRQGKDRPVVVVGLAGPELVVVPLTSKDHGADPDYFPVGGGAWDPKRRPSFVRLDFAYAVAEAGVRREGAALDRSRFDALAAELRSRRGWT